MCFLYKFPYLSIISMNEEQKSPVMEGQKSSPALGVVIGLVVVLVAGGFIYSRSKTPTEPTTPVATDTSNRMMNPSSTPPVATTPATFNAYKDGTYTAEGEYQVHRGPEKVKITVTIKDNKITDTKFEGTPAFAMSQRYMDMFSQNYQAMVVGKNVNEVKLDKVSGSSLTPMGFNNALEKIKQEAGVTS